MDTNAAANHKKRKGLRIWLVASIVGACLITLLLILIYTQYLHSFDSFLINISGRERMLSQKISKELLLYKSDKSIIRSIGISIYLFENTLLALRDGGEVFTDLQLIEKRKIPPVSDPVLLDEIKASLDLWDKLKDEANAYVNTEDHTYLDGIILINPVLLERLNSITLILQENSEWQHLVDNIILAVFAILIILMLLVFLRNKVVELRKATQMIESLETILPICANCKKIREKSDGENQEDWISIEEYISKKNATKFTHGICPDCAKKLYPELMK
jgi:hypothetical protein